jgi:hypothetical protein
MKKSTLLFFSIFILGSNIIFADFNARRLTDSQTWWNTQIQKCESKIEVYGLLYETTINLKMKLGKGYRWDLQDYYCQNPYPGQYEFIWTFSLPKNAYIKELNVWDAKKGSFVQTSVINLSSAESLYNPSSTSSTNVLLRQYMRRDYNGSYNLQYDLRVSPINWDESVEFVIKYVSPCEESYEKRIIEDYSYVFYTNYSSDCYTSTLPKYMVRDYNNPDIAPENFQSFSKTWTKQGDYWVVNLAPPNDYPSYFKLSFPSESPDGKFLRTASQDPYLFYQLSTKPFITDGQRFSRKIVIAFDIIQQYMGDYSRNNFLGMIKDALMISTTDKDSLVFVTSDFNVKWLNDNFQQRSENFINTQLNQVNQIVPKLNTLPYMLKDIVQYLNEKRTDAEVWLISDDYQTGVRAETVMDLLDQTFYSAKNKIVFNIIDVSNSYYGYYIQNKNYRGNEYLYENLTRLSGGNFGTTYSKYYKYFIDEVLDCWAPKISTVEIDPIPQNGLSYSRIDLNNGRNNFNITSRYFQLGMFYGNSPFTLNYFGNYSNGSYFNTIQLNDDNISVSDSLLQNTRLFWYGDYIMNDLFLQPQSYATIKYIEELSAQNHLITPYSGFVIPGVNGYVGFKRIYVDEIPTSVEEPKKQQEQTSLPTELSLSSYPNPFNPQTTIILKLTAESIKGEKSLDIYNILGQMICSFDLSQYKNSSEIKVQWNGLNDAGFPVSSGVYFAIFKTPQTVKSLKLLLVR